MGKVPVLHIDEKIMFESMTICNYLDQVYPHPPLYPSDPWNKAMDDNLIETFNSKVFNNNLLHLIFILFLLIKCY